MHSRAPTCVMPTISHWSWKATWPSPKSRGREIYSAHNEAMAKVRMQEGMKHRGQ